VAASKVDLARLKPYAVFFASFPRELILEGIAQSQVRVTQEQGSYHVSSDSTRIQNFRLVSPEKEAFEQPQVTALFDVFIDPNQKTINVERLQVDSPQIKIRKGEFRRTSQDNRAKLQGALDAQVDWAAVAPLASAFVPDELVLAGQRQVSINFASAYPADEPNALLANLDSRASLGFDRAEYLGFTFGATELDIRVENGLMTIGPLSTTVNNGKLNFAGRANLGRTPALLGVPEALSLLQGVEINAQTSEKLLKYVNPIFANAVSVTGIANFDLQELAIPLAGGAKERPQLVGTLSIDKLTLGASNVLNQILSVIGESVRDQVLTVHPTKITLQNGVVRYDDMQIDVGDNPVNFGGAIGLDGVLNMTVVLPYTYEGRTAHVGDKTARRISLPLTGTIDKPQLNLQKALESQIKEQIFKGLEDLLKRR
jgi:hypothetical protein